MLADLLYRLKALLRPKAMDRELDDELRFHLERQSEKEIQAGQTPNEAVRRSRMALGGVEQVKEECREARGVSLLESTMQDIRYAIRILRKSPGFTAVVTLSLALGIGANTAIFSLIDALLFRTLPVRNPEQLYLVGTTDRGVTWYGFPFRQYRLLQDHNRFFTDLAAYSPVRLSASIDGSLEPTINGQMVSGGYFMALGVNAVAGRTIGPEDDRSPDAHPVAMISHGYWKRRFGQAASTIGRTITLCGRPFTIIGVTPPEFFGLEVGTAPDIFAPVMMQPTLMPSSENLLTNPILMATWLRTFGRLNSGVSVPQASAGIDAIFQEYRRAEMFRRGPDLKGPSADVRLVLTSAATGLSDLRRQFSQPLFILMTVVGIVLLIACANTANLLLARAAARQPEFAMRLAVGAGRGRLMRQLLVESILLASLGGVCGILLARWGTQLLVKFMSSGGGAIVIDLAPDLRILGFTAAVSMLTGVLFGFAPAMRATGIDLIAALKGKTGWIGSGRAGLRPGKILAVSQIALSLLLLIGAGLFVRSLQKLNGQDAGFPRESVIMVRVEPKGSDQRGIPGTSVRLDGIYRNLLARVESIPGVRSASMAHFTPTNRIGFSSPTKLPSGEEMRVSRLMVYPKYFATMGMPMVAGRDFQGPDLAENAPLVAVVNEAFARQAFKGESAVGKTFGTSAGRRGMLPCEIIGVVKDSRYASLRGETPPVIYQTFFQTNTGRGQMSLHVRLAGDAASVVPRIREEVHSIDTTLPVFELRTLAQELDAALIRERLIALLSSFFGALALLLACVGLYGLMAFSVVRRSGEMGIRIALGARPGAVVSMVMRETIVLVLIGVAIGIPAALAISRLASSQISGLLFGLTPTDPITILGATAVMSAVAAIAGYLPARRASQADPMVALRSE